MPTTAGTQRGDGNGASGWQLEASSSEAYERNLVPEFFAAFAERLIERVAPTAAERVLDVACGTGIVARLTAPRVGADGAVVGLDSNREMLDVARVVWQLSEPDVEWVRADAADMPLSDGSFDLVLCQQGLQFFDDRSAALREMHRVLAPGGRVGISVWRPIEHSPGFSLLAGALERRVGTDVAEIMRSPFPAIGGEGLRELLDAAGLREVDLRIEIGSVRFPSPRELLAPRGRCVADGRRDTGAARGRA